MFALAVRLLSLGAASAVHTLRQTPGLSKYSFEQFIQDHGRTYQQGSDEYQHRLALFQASLARIESVNTKNQREHRSWTSGIHKFMDWSEAERKGMNGYKPSRTGLHRMTALQSQQRTHLRASSYSMNKTNHLAESFSWDHLNLPIVNQGSCGSCWAISASEALEAQLQMRGHSSNVKVSAQALVDCVPNPQHCGGTGGCDGATGELAYAFVRDHGIPMDSDLTYTAQTGKCQYPEGLYPASQRVRVSGFHALPSNKYAPLMNAVAQEGPTVVSVDGNSWFDYYSGVFDGCEKDAILGHAVLLVGYGSDKGKPYWRIQNSWGADWGEQGYIRLTRHVDEESWCGIDNKPQEGSGCDGGPSEITVCGMCGILYEALVPQNVRVESGN
jgi:cathepsin L